MPSGGLSRRQPVSSATQKSRRHHYVPVFYLRRWESVGRLCQYSRPHRQVVPQMKAATAVGFEIDLYSVHGFPTESQTALEDRFLKQVDQIASNALGIMLDGSASATALSPRLRDGWSRFLMSLHYRSPTRLTALKERCRQHFSANLGQYEKLFHEKREPGDTRSFDDFCDSINRSADQRLWAEVFWRIVDSKGVGDFLNRMIWRVVSIKGSDRSFLTSDNPLIRTDGLDQPNGHILLPLGPSELFVATNTEEMLAWFRALPPRDLQARVNDVVARQASRFVYGENDKQLRFIEKRLVK
jgi:hypothetical protein